jgi:hypothetical protein
MSLGSIALRQIGTLKTARSSSKATHVATFDHRRPPDRKARISGHDRTKICIGCEIFRAAVLCRARRSSLKIARAQTHLLRTRNSGEFRYGS